MTSFRDILKTAEKRAGGKAALAKRLPTPKSAAELRTTGDDRYLSLMSLRVFRAGLRHGMVDDRWPAFEEVFFGFAPKRVRAMSDEAVEALMNDTRLIRHWPKMKSVHENAAAIAAAAEESGSFGAYLAGWPADDVVGLWEDLTKRCKQMGGNSGPTFLRMAGRDTFILTGHVVQGLNQWGAYDGTPKGKGARRQVQEAFNRWATETQKPLCHLSMILAGSVG